MDEFVLLFLGAASSLLMIALARSIKKPLIWLWYGLVYSTLGALILILINSLGNFFAFSLPVNLFTASVVGGMGLPGICYLLLARWLIFS